MSLDSPPPATIPPSIGASFWTTPLLSRPPSPPVPPLLGAALIAWPGCCIPGCGICCIRCSPGWPSWPGWGCCCCCCLPISWLSSEEMSKPAMSRAPDVRTAPHPTATRRRVPRPSLGDGGGLASGSATCGRKTRRATQPDRDAVRYPLRAARSASFTSSAAFSPITIDRRVRVTPDDRRHHRRVGHAQPFDAPYPQFRVHHRGGVGAHAAGADRVVQRLCVPADRGFVQLRAGQSGQQHVAVAVARELRGGGDLLAQCDAACQRRVVQTVGVAQIAGSMVGAAVGSSVDSVIVPCEWGFCRTALTV